MAVLRDELIGLRSVDDIITKATLADAFQVALQRLGAAVTKAAPST